MASEQKILTRLAAGLFTTATVLAAPLALAQTDSPIRDQDRTAYNTVYGEKITSVKRTRAISDDLALAKEMMAFSLNIPNDPGVQCLIYIDVIELASNASDLALMHESASLLHDRWPSQDAISSEVLMQLASRSFRGVDRQDRETQGEHYIALLLDIAKRYQDLDDNEQAISVYRLASTVARTINSDQYDPIQQAIDQLTAAAEVAQRIEMLELSVKKNPQNTPAANELVRLLITWHYDLDKASQYAPSTRNEELIDLLNHCIKGIDQANAATAMRIADWHLNLAEEEADERALPLLQQARQWYARFNTLYSRDDALARRVAEMDKLALFKIESLIAENPKLIGKNKAGWQPMIAPPFDPKDHILGEAKRIEVNEGELTIEDAAVMIPFTPTQAYEVRVTLTVNEHAVQEEPVIVIALPFDENRQLITRYFVGHSEIAQIDEVAETQLIQPAPAKVGQKHQLTFQVVQAGDELAFAMLYNGRAGLKWQGQLESLGQISEETLELIPEDLGPVIRIRSKSKVTFHAIDYKARD